MEKGTDGPSDNVGLRGGLKLQAQLRAAAKLRRSQGLPFSRTPLPKEPPQGPPEDPLPQGGGGGEALGPPLPVGTGPPFTGKLKMSGFLSFVGFSVLKGGC